MASRKKSSSSASPLERTRSIIAAWPQTDERISHGSPTWWGGKKTFANFHDNHHGDGRVALWIKADADTQEDLVGANPELFFVPPYVGHRGWVGAIVGTIAGGSAGGSAPEARIDWQLIESLLEAGYRSVAPKKAIQELDAAQKK